MFSISFLISIIRIATFVIFAFLFEKIFYNRNLNSEQKKLYNYNSRNNISSYLIIGLSVSTIFNITEDSYIYRINSLMAIYGPWLFILTGVLILIKNLKYNIRVKQKIFENKID